MHHACHIKGDIYINRNKNGSCKCLTFAWKGVQNCLCKRKVMYVTLKGFIKGEKVKQIIKNSFPS